MAGHSKEKSSYSRECSGVLVHDERLVRMIPAFWLLGEVAARDVRVSDFIERGMLVFGSIPGEWTPVMKAASSRPIVGSGHGSGNHIQSLTLAGDLRHRSHQTLRVRMMRRTEQTL